MDSKKLPITLYLYNQPISERISNLLESYNELFEKVEVIDTNSLVMAGNDKTSHWNYLAYNSETPWVLFLDDNENFESLDLSFLHQIDQNTWCSCITNINTDKGIESYHQARLVLSGIEGIFQGVELPDASNYILDNNIQFLNKSINIQSDSIPWEYIDISQERLSLNTPVNLYLHEARMYITEQKFTQAAGSYRVALKKERLLPFDYLAALNGLARCYVEQHKWTRALELMEYSIELEPQQHLPYLIQYKVYQLSKNWDAAVTSLNSYLLNYESISRSSHDIKIPYHETVLELSNLHLDLGQKDLAYEFYCDFLNTSLVSVRESHHLALKMAIGLEKKREANRHFKFLYPNILELNLDVIETKQFHDYMEMFLENNWHSIVEKVYTRLYEANLTNRMYRRKLIATLVRADKLELAREIMQKVA